jgi:hypothetical protein
VLSRRSRAISSPRGAPSSLLSGCHCKRYRTPVEVLEGTRERQDPRLGQDLWLTNNQGVVLTQKQLREVVEGEGYGVVFDNALNYRRAVDERLFHLGSKRYEALMDTLIQLRQPQLARKPDENGLSHALTEALPPIPPELLGDVAEALNQLEEDREQLEKTRQLEHAIKQFEQRYRVYAGMLTRRQARELRQAQTAFDYASEERNKALNEFQKSEEAAAAASIAHEAAKRSLLGAQERRETLQSGPANQDANRFINAASAIPGSNLEDCISQAEQDAQDRLADLTLGAGLLAVEGKPQVDSWYFLQRCDFREKSAIRRILIWRANKNSANNRINAVSQQRAS